MNNIKNFLNLLQVICVVMIVIAALQYVCPNLAFVSFAKPINDSSVFIFSKFFNMNMNGVDWTLAFLVVPWVIYIIIIGFIVDLLDNLTSRVNIAITTYRHKKITEITQEQNLIKEQALQKKQTIYLAVSLIFSKFTISSLSDNEIKNKKEVIKNDLVSDLYNYRGKLILDEEFDDDNTFAVIFFSQEDAINYIIKVKESLKILDDDVQEFGYSVGFKAVLDAQNPEAIKFYVLQFMEKILNAVEQNEICTTNAFADRYLVFGKIKNIEFCSKGNYSINKERVELKRMIV